MDAPPPPTRMPAAFLGHGDVVRPRFVGLDAVAAVTADLAARLAEVEAHRALSVSTDGRY